MTVKINNNSKLTVFTFKLTSVQYKGEEKPLEYWDKAKVYAAFVIGFLFAVVGSPIAGFATSYYLRNRKIKQLKLAEAAADRVRRVAADRVRQAARLKKEAYKIHEDTENLIQLRASHYKLAHVPLTSEKRLVESNPNTHYYKPMHEPLPPTVKAALWRRAYLYR